MSKQKKREETLKIISLFRERKLLWDTNRVSYRNADLRKRALEEIAEECNLPEESVKKKLKALRDTYAIEKKKVEQSKKSGCDPADVYESGLFWYGEMSFLDGSIPKRKSRNNVSNNIPDESFYLDESSTSMSCDSDVSYTPSNSSKRKFQEVINTAKFDEAINIIVNSNTSIVDAFSTFADSMAMTLRSMPERTAYLAMRDIQHILYQRKLDSL